MAKTSPFRLPTSSVKYKPLNSKPPSPGFIIPDKIKPNKQFNSKPPGPGFVIPDKVKSNKMKSATKLGAAVGVGAAAGSLVPMGLGLYAAHKLRKPFKMHDHSSEEIYDDDYYRRRQYYPNEYEDHDFYDLN